MSVSRKQRLPNWHCLSNAALVTVKTDICFSMLINITSSLGDTANLLLFRQQCQSIAI